MHCRRLGAPLALMAQEMAESLPEDFRHGRDRLAASPMYHLPFEGEDNGQA